MARVTPSFGALWLIGGTAGSSANVKPPRHFHFPPEGRRGALDFCVGVD
jgi:hypothetical protein